MDWGWVWSALHGVDSVLDWVVTKAPMVGVFTAVAAVWLAVRGYDRWLSETVGKRKSEFAEEVLTEFYQAREAIKYARFNVFGPGYVSSRKVVGAETGEQKVIRDNYYRIIERIDADHVLFDGLRSKRFRAKAYFDDEAEKPFDDLQTLLGRLRSAAGTMMQYKGLPEEPPIVQQLYATVGDYYDPLQGDDFSAEVDAVIADVEKRYGKWLMRRKSK